MRDVNQGDGGDGAIPPPPPSETPPAPPPWLPPTDPPPAAPSGSAGAAPVPPAAEGPPILRGLRVWLVLMAVMGVVGLVAGQAELAVMVALAGAFAAAHAADRDPSHRPLHLILTGVLVAGGAALFAGLAVWLATQGPAGPLRPLAVGIAGGAAVLSVLTAWRPLSDGMASAVFRSLEQTHVLRLGGRLVLMVLLFAVPGWVAFPTLLDLLAAGPRPLLDTAELLASLAGLTLLSLGGVGFLVRRDLRATLDRLGLALPRPSHLAVAVAGVAVLWLLNTGIEAAQRVWFPSLWQHDQRINAMLAGGLGLGGGVLLGISAGVGEELAMRGALQPRLGLVFTALVFAVLHVHYSWFGVATILLMGVALGIIRQRTSTTVAILVHTVYDILAVLSARGA